MNRFAALACLACAALVGCADLTEPSGASQEPAAPTPAAAPAPQPAAAPPTPTPRPAPDRNTNVTRIRASHILIGWKGSRRVQATRSQDEAQKMAEQLLGRVRGGGMDFAEAAKKYSDDPSAKKSGGDLGLFDRNTMAPEFTKAAFDLQVGQISNVVKTEFGYHIIKRTE
jgi:hypothetical protein